MSPEPEKYKHKNPYGIERQQAFFLLFWFILNIIQVSFTELTSDEGYYWFYAQHLQWGYYDHPPMIAAMIKAGSSILPGELGVRFLNVVSSTAGLYLFFQLLPKEFRNSKKTFLILLAAPLLHYLTFIVFPDGPLLFFSLLFLFIYKQFLQKQSLAIAILMGVSLALMAYSKYHGALILLFVVLANPRLLRSGYFYLSLFIAAIFFVPHIWWQYQQDFPTLKYHLSGRTGSLSFKHVGEYISQQIVAIGPGLIFLPFVIKTKDVFERTLKFIIIGTFVFFLFSSFKTFVHFHWTSIALFPLLYFAVEYYNQPQKKKLFNALLLPFVFLFLLVRIVLVVPVIPNMHAGEDYYHGRKQWAKDIASIAGNRYVFMPNNLREASLYSFYSGKQGVTLYNQPGKKSQYELWGYEDTLQGKEVLFVAKYPFVTSVPLSNALQQNLYHALIPSFRSYYYSISVDAKVEQSGSDSILANVEMINHRLTPLHFINSPGSDPARLIISFEDLEKKLVHTYVLQNLMAADSIAPKSRIKRVVRFPAKELQSTGYRFFAAIRTGLLPDAILSEQKFIDIKP